MELFLLVSCFVITVLAVISFFHYLVNGKELTSVKILTDCTLFIFLPLISLIPIIQIGTEDMCLVFYSIFTLLSIIAYFHSTYRKHPGSRAIEFIINCLLLSGMIINILIIKQLHNDKTLYILGLIPIGIMLLVGAMALLFLKATIMNFRLWNINRQANKHIDKV